MNPVMVPLMPMAPVPMDAVPLGVLFTFGWTVAIPLLAALLAIGVAIVASRLRRARRRRALTFVLPTREQRPAAA